VPRKNEIVGTTELAKEVQDISIQDKSNTYSHLVVSYSFSKRIWTDA